MRGRKIRVKDSGVIGLGAMILFVAVVILAVLVGSTIIMVVEQISQQTEKTSADSDNDISRKIIVEKIWIGDSMDDYLIIINYHASGDTITPGDVEIQFYCTSNTGSYRYFSTPLVDPTTGGTNPGGYGYGGLDIWEISADPASGNTATLEPGHSYFIRLDGDPNNNVATNCRPSFLQNQGVKVNLWFHINGGQSTHEVFRVHDSSHGTVLL